MVSFEKINPNISLLNISNPHFSESEFHWLNIGEAGKKEIEFLRREFGFELPDLRASLQNVRTHRPIFQQRDGYLFLILHFPILSGHRVECAEIEFFIKDNFLVTIPNTDLPSLNDLFRLYKKDAESRNGYRYASVLGLFYDILERLLDDTYKLLDYNLESLEEVEGRIFTLQSKKAVSKILSLRRNVINTQRILQNHKTIIKKIIQAEYEHFPNKEVRNLFFNLLENSKRIWENLQSQRDLVDVLNQTNESLMNYRISYIMKTLTLFSVIVFPLTLMSSMFGMNTIASMPFIDHPYGFWIILAVMAIMSISMLWYFSKKKWL